MTFDASESNVCRKWLPPKAMLRSVVTPSPAEGLTLPNMSRHSESRRQRNLGSPNRQLGIFLVPIKEVNASACCDKIDIRIRKLIDLPSAGCFEFHIDNLRERLPKNHAVCAGFFAAGDQPTTIICSSGFQLPE